jgi:hypothetical protein
MRFETDHALISASPPTWCIPEEVLSFRGTRYRKISHDTTGAYFLTDT